MRRYRCHWNLLGGLALALALTGCAVGPAYQRPATPTPASWTATPDTAQWPAVDWWHAFDDATLDQLETQALAANHDLRAAVARVAEAAAQARIAGAGLYPSLGLDAESGRAQPFSKGGQQKTKLYNYYQLGLTASYELDLFGQNRSQAQAAAVGLAASRFDRDTVRLGLTAAVANSYFSLSTLDARLKIARDAIATAQSTSELVQIQQRNGMASAQQVAQQESELATITASIPELETQRRQTLTALALLLGQVSEGFAPVPQALDAIPIPTPPAGLPSELLKHRPDVARAEAELIAASANVRAATAALYPHIDLTAQGGSGSLALQQLFQPASTFFALAAGLTAPLFDGGKLHGQLDYSQARYHELLENYQQAVLAAFGDTDDALDAQGHTQAALTSRAEAARQAAHAAQLAGVQYRGGSVSYLTVLDSQRTALTARDAEAQARLARLQAAVALYQALGGGWQRHLTSPGGEGYPDVLRRHTTD